MIIIICTNRFSSLRIGFLDLKIIFPLYCCYIRTFIFANKKSMKFSLTVLCCLLSLFFLTGTASAQSDSTKRTPFKHSLGAAAGITTGYGLSYRYWPKKIGAQITFAPSSNGDRTLISTGLTFLFKLVQTERANLFLYQGNHLYYSKNKYYYYLQNPSTFEETNLYNGVGLGIEFIIVKRVSLNLMGGYAAYENFDRFSMSGETGLFFKF